MNQTVGGQSVNTATEHINNQQHGHQPTNNTKNDQSSKPEPYTVV